MYIRASSQVSAGAPEKFSRLDTLVFVSFHPRSAKFWLPLYGSLCQSSIMKVRSISLTLRDTSAFALSLMSLSMAPSFRISSMRVGTKFLSEDPRGLTVR